MALLQRLFIIGIVVLNCHWSVCAKFTEKRIVESTVIGSIVYKLPKILDGNLQYVLYEEGDPAAVKHFVVSPEGEIKLKSRLEYFIGKDNSILVVVVLRNKLQNFGGKAHTVKFIIDDTNNHSPTFAKKLYNGQIEEGKPADTVVSGLEDCYATDLDMSGIIDYTIVEGNNKNEFKVAVEKRGDIKLLVVRTNKKLDRDEMRLTPYLDLLVRVNDGGKGEEQKFETTVIRITITDRNDNPPVFLRSKWQNTVQENAQVMSSILKVSASDNDEGQNSEVYYHFKELYDNFVINPATGVISVAAPLNEDIQNVYQLTVIAQDKATQSPLSAEAFVKIQVLNVPNYPPQIVYRGKNSPPRFPKRKHSVTVRQDVPVYSTIFFVPAKDNDPFGRLSKLQYRLDGIHSKMFHISRESGVVTLNRSLKSFNSKVIQLYVSVDDGVGETASMDVEINIQSLDTNFYNPVFFPSTVSLSIPQNINPNTEIGFTANADDQDGANNENGKVSYNIVDGSGIGRFSVNMNTGKIATTDIFKNPSIFDLYIRAQDNGKYRRTGMLYIRIKVVANDNVAPVMSRAMYLSQIPEKLGTNAFVAAVFAKSLTSAKPVQFQVNNPREVSSLAIDSETGVITTTMPLNYEITKSLVMEISATVKGQRESSKTIVSVDVINVNNHPPVFTRSSITVYIGENSGNIPSLACLFATDKDGSLGTMSYSIKSGNVGNAFSIGEKTG